MVERSAVLFKTEFILCHLPQFVSRGDGIDASSICHQLVQDLKVDNRDGITALIDVDDNGGNGTGWDGEICRDFVYKDGEIDQLGSNVQ